MGKCGRCDVANADTNHFCTHCGCAFPCECVVCYDETTRYGRCGHAICASCEHRLPTRECPMCRVSLDDVAVAVGRSMRNLTDLDELVVDIKMFDLDLVQTLLYRCCRSRFTSYMQYDAKFLVRPILSIPLFASKAQLAIPGWTRVRSLASEDVAFMQQNREQFADIDLRDKDEAFFIVVHLREFYGAVA
jgi:hypothetical protein